MVSIEYIGLGHYIGGKGSQIKQIEDRLPSQTYIVTYNFEWLLEDSILLSYRSELQHMALK